MKLRGRDLYRRSYDEGRAKRLSFPDAVARINDNAALIASSVTAPARDVTGSLRSSVNRADEDNRPGLPPTLAG
jgi:hypothetical protein